MPAKDAKGREKKESSFSRFFAHFAGKNSPAFSAASALRAKRQGTNAFGTGRSPFDPNCWIDTPAVERFEYHVAVDGRNTVVSNLPSPS